MNTRNGNEPRKVIVKTMTVNRGVDDVFNFFENIKNMEIGGAIKSVTKGRMNGGHLNTLFQGNLRFKVGQIRSLEFSIMSL